MAHVLVVDDDADILNLVVQRLRRGGHRVVGAPSGQAAVELIKAKGAPQIAVLDVSMPDMDGLELLQNLRSHEDMKNLPAIFLSAKVQPDDIAAGRALGATYLTKPFVATALLSAIENAVPKEEEDGW